MENASKALIIAGAILLAILIIGLGIFIYRQAANTVIDTGMDQLSIQQFNGQFENYIKTNVSASNVRALLDTVSSNNATSETKVTVKWKTNMPTDVLEDSLVTKDQLSSAVKYNVTDNSNTSKTGLITEIYVSIAS
ncbi:MAG: hypothetical protein U0N02_01030 [Clostridia bacterium]